MKLIIACTPKDHSAVLIKQEAIKLGLPCQLFFYRDLLSKRVNLEIGEKDKIILRASFPPYGRDKIDSFAISLAKKIVQKYPNNILLDKKSCHRFLEYEDKLFQASFFSDNNFPTPKTFPGKELAQINSFPVIAKKRKSSRCRGNFLINRPDELKKFFQNKHPSEYLIQKFIPVKKDLRILILNQQVVGIISRNIKLKSNKRVAANVAHMIKKISPQIIGQALAITLKLKLDFCGMDVVIEKNNRYYFLEANISPQFTDFSRITKTNAAKQIIDLAR